MSSQPPSAPVRRLRLGVLSLLLLAACLPGGGTVAAEWRLVGPEGGNLQHLARAIDRPESVFAAGPAGGLHRSTDGGESWESLLHRLPVAAPAAVATGPLGQTVIVYSEATLHVSKDGGATWSSVERDLGEVGQLVIAPSDPDVVYATERQGSPRGRTWRSDDGGLTWVDVSPDWDALYAGDPPVATELGLTHLAVDPTDGERVFGAHRFQHLLLTENGGATWQIALPDVDPTAVEVHPDDPSSVAVATGFGFWSSEDGGAAWEQRFEEYPFRRFLEVEAVPGVPGEWWVIEVTDVGGRFPNVYSVRRVGADQAVWPQIYSSQGVLTDLSSGAGEPWLIASQAAGVLVEEAEGWRSARGIHAQLAVRVEAVDDEPSTLGATVEGPTRHYLSRDGGVTWDTGFLVEGGRRPVNIVELAMPSLDRPYLLADHALIRPRAGRVLTAEVANGAYHRALTVDPTRPNRLWVVTWSGEGCALGPCAPTASRLHRSDDDGETFSVVATPQTPERLLLDVLADPAVPRRLYVSASGEGGGRILFSDDRGATWEVRGGGLPAPLERLAAVSTPEGTFLYGYTAEVPGTVFRSFDLGATWSPLAAGLPANVAVTAVGASPRPGGWIYAGTAEGGVYFLGADPLDAELWVPLDGELPGLPVVDLEVVPGVEVVLATLENGGGIFRHGVALDCDPTSALMLCAGEGDRFRLEVDWDVVVEGRLSTGVGRGNELTTQAGWFWFFNQDNAELAVKVLDGRPVNGNWWVFYASLSNVGFDLAVTDTATGAFRVYRNPRTRLASRGDTDAFDGETPLLPAAVPGEVPRASSADAVPSATSPDGVGSGHGLSGTELVPLSDLDPFAASGATDGSFFLTLPASTGLECGGREEDLCLQGGRFRVEATWKDFEGGNGIATGVPISDDSGYLWFFRQENLELFVKVLDGRPVNGHWWVFYGSLSNVAFEVTVTDTQTQETQTYTNPEGTFASVADTTAF